MYAQTLLIVMITLTLGSALLTNGLLSTRAAFHGLTTRYLDAAMTESVANATAQLRAYVQTNGTNGPWPAGVQSLGSGSLCDTSAQAAKCPFTYQASWQITGSSSPLASPSPGPDLAQNLQIDVINEQRVAAAVTLTMTGRSSGETMGSRTRYLTIRVLRLPPYAIVSGVRDYQTVNGRFTAAEGDTGGVPADVEMRGASRDLASPNPNEPDQYRDTTIKIIVECHDVQSRPDPMAANGATQNDGLPWGVNSSRAYEAPCVPPIGLVTPPPGSPPVQMDYGASDLRNGETWSTGAAPLSTEPP
jgi:hypothetical protein